MKKEQPCTTYAQFAAMAKRFNLIRKGSCAKRSIRFNSSIRFNIMKRGEWPRRPDALAILKASLRATLGEDDKE